MGIFEPELVVDEGDPAVEDGSDDQPDDLLEPLAAARGELRADVDPVLALETLVGPMYVRMLMTGEPLDDALLVRCVDLVLDGIATRPR